jgi:TfoX/Sxy family transcriptional regulator of competence genes
MAFDSHLADRVRQRLGKRRGVSEKEMFGGLGFLLHGNMACGILGDEMIVRLGAEAGEEALREAHTRPFDFTGRPMKGWLFVEGEALDDEDALDRWVERAVQFVSGLPKK